MIWFFYFICMLIGQTINNVFWVNKGGEWYGDATVENWFGCWTGPIKQKSKIEILDYIIKYRIITVWTNWRDISSALLAGLLFSILI